MKPTPISLPSKRVIYAAAAMYVKYVEGAAAPAALNRRDECKRGSRRWAFWNDVMRALWKPYKCQCWTDYETAIWQQIYKTAGIA